MRRASQSALQRYKTRRGATVGPESGRGRPARPRWGRVLALSGILTVAWAAVLLVVARPREAAPVDLTYELDFQDAADGTLMITLVCDGGLPAELDLALAPGMAAGAANAVRVRDPQAHELGDDGRELRALAVTATEDGWRLDTRGCRRAGFVYRVDLRAVAGSEQDVRRHLSTPVTGGVRAAGFDIFLEPLGVPVEGLTVAVRNPARLPLLVPWPALVRDGAPTAPGGPVEAVGEASLGYGRGFRPVEDAPVPSSLDAPAAAAPVPTNVMYHPRDLADLNNALLVCGDLRVLSAQAGNTVIQLATDRDWLFADTAALDLVRRIARTEMGFFGSAPSEQITVLLAANEITGSERFDVYGVHTGSSVLVMLDPRTTWGSLEEQAASVIAHEMFHGWLGESIRQTEPDLLWFTEGATTWYAARMLTAAGVWPTDHARGVLGARLDRDYANSPLRGKMSVAAAAAEVMASNEQVRYGYAGSAAACMALDEMLARSCGRQRPLDQVLRHLYAEGPGQPLTRPRLEAALRSVTGVDCAAWLDTYVYGKTALPPVADML